MLAYVLGTVAITGWLTAAYLGMKVCELEEIASRQRGLLTRSIRSS
jgi:hypothetical protein